MITTTIIVGIVLLIAVWAAWLSLNDKIDRVNIDVDGQADRICHRLHDYYDLLKNPPDPEKPRPRKWYVETDDDGHVFYADSITVQGGELSAFDGRGVLIAQFPDGKWVGFSEEQD